MIAALATPSASLAQPDPRDREPPAHEPAPPPSPERPAPARPPGVATPPPASAPAPDPAASPAPDSGRAAEPAPDPALLQARRDFASGYLTFSDIDVRRPEERERVRGGPRNLGEPIVGDDREPLPWGDFFRMTGHPQEADTFERRTRRRTGLAVGGALLLASGAAVTIYALVDAVKVHDCVLVFCHTDYSPNPAVLVVGPVLLAGGAILTGLLAAVPRPFVSSGRRVMGYARDYNKSLRRELGLPGSGDLRPLPPPKLDGEEDADKEAGGWSLRAPPALTLSLAPWASPGGGGASLLGVF